MRQWAAFYAGASRDPGPEARRIAEYVSEMVPDGSTIQIGAGTPSTLLAYPRDVSTASTNLGIHSEMAAPGMIDLIDKGIVTGRYTNTHPGSGPAFSALTATNNQRTEVGRIQPQDRPS